MRHAPLIASAFLAASSALAQAPAPGPAPDAPSGTAGGFANWWWIVLIVIVVAAAIWYYTRSRSRI